MTESTQTPGYIEGRTARHFNAIWEAIVQYFAKNYVFDSFDNRVGDFFRFCGM